MADMKIHQAAGTDRDWLRIETMIEYTRGETQPARAPGASIRRYYTASAILDLSSLEGFGLRVKTTISYSSQTI